MKLSVVIPTYKRLSMLMELIDSMVPERELIYELIVVIDSDEDPAYKKAIDDKYAGLFKLTVYMQPNSGRATTRNKGVELSSGDILLFFDDDMVVETGTIKAHCDFHAQSQWQILVGNGNRNPAQAKTDFARFLINMEKGWNRGPEARKISYENFSFTTQNLSMPRKMFIELGKLDDRLKLAVEDTEMAIRALKAGITIINDGRLNAWHNDWPGVKAFIRRSNEYIESIRVLLIYHPEVLEVFPNIMPKGGSSAKKAVLKIVRNTIGPMIVNENALFRLLPLQLKFKMYNLAISANTSINL